LFNSIITQVDIKTGKVNTIKSQTYDINIDLARDDNNKIGDRERDEMYPDDLLAYIKNEKIPVGSRLKAKMEFQEKFSLPFACITLGLLAVPLGVRSAFSRKGSGIGLGFACFMVYYLLLVLGGSLGKSGKMSPLLAMWSPDIVTGITGIYFFYRVSREKSIGLEPLTDKYNSIRNKIKTRNKKALL
jgi:lipopolysaccharide export system permease protein